VRLGIAMPRAVVLTEPLPVVEGDDHAVIGRRLERLHRSVRADDGDEDGRGGDGVGGQHGQSLSRVPVDPDIHSLRALLEKSSVGVEISAGVGSGV